MQQPDLIQIFLGPLEAQNKLYFVTGSVASIFYGEPRLTHDIDLVLHLEFSEIHEFLGLYPFSDFYCPPEEVIQVEMRRKPFGHFNLIHHRTGLKADVYTGKYDELHAWAFAHRKRIEFSEIFSFWLAPAEYVILRKLEFYREGSSEKHMEDIQKMLPQIQGTLDMPFLKAQISKRSLEKAALKFGW